jgi:hypothetical protein
MSDLASAKSEEGDEGRLPVAKIDSETTQDSAVSNLISSTLAMQNVRSSQHSVPSSSPKRHILDDLDFPNKRTRRENDDHAAPMNSPTSNANMQGGTTHSNLMDGSIRARAESFDASNVSDVLRSFLATQDANRLANARIRAELSTHILQEQVAWNASANARILSSLGRPNLDSLLGPSFGSLSSGLSFATQESGLQHQQAQLAVLRNFADLHALQRQRSNNLGMSLTGSSSSLGLGVAQGMPDFGSFLQHLASQQNSTGSSSQQNSSSCASFQDLILWPGAASMQQPSSISAHSPSASLKQISELPVCEEGRLGPYFARSIFPLGVDEDPNWLSEFHCFVRSELVEIFRASHEDVKARNYSVVYQQVGMRCCFCAHLSPNARAGRSSAFPSSLRQIYQSFTMMLRDHFSNCTVIPAGTQEKFLALKDKPAQGATDSKRFWIYSAMKVGLADSANGIIINQHTRTAGASAPSFGTHPGQPWADDTLRSVHLALPADRGLVSEFLYLLTCQAQLIHLTEAERIGNRRSLRFGLPGFGCRYCCEQRRLGLCRMFPARRRTLPHKMSDMYDHIRRCPACPASVKEQLKRTQHEMVAGFGNDQGGEREFFDRVWSRLGHGTG